MQGLLVALLVAVLALAVTDVVDDWSDWLVLGAIVVATVAVAAAVHNRQYPSRKRSFTRGPDSRW
jgi:uncharacterized membrane protein